MKMHEYQDFEGCTILRSNESGKMYVYQLTHDYGGSIKTIGYFSSWKKARAIMKKYRASIEGFRDYPNCFLYKWLK